MARLRDVVVDVEQAEEAENSSGTIFSSLANFCMRNYLPIGTVFSIIIGIFLPQPAVFFSKRIPVVKICIIVLFFTIGLRMRLVEAKSAVKSYKEMIVGLLLILFISPMYAINLLNQVPYFGSFIDEAGYQNLRNFSNGSIEEMPILGPEEFRLALQVYLMCPSAPATALVLVTAANGHRGLSILLAIVCTIISVFTIPPMLAWFIYSLQHIHIDVANVLLKTLLRVLLPLVAGRCLRFASPVKKVVKKWNNTVKYIGLTFLIAVFLVKVSETTSSGNLEKVSIVNILAVVGLGLSFTTFNLIASYACFSLLPGFSKQSTLTLAILCSIRVVSFAATIIDVLPESAGDKGLIVLPMVFVYLSTVLMLNGFISFVKVKEDEDAKVEEPAETVEPVKNRDTKNEDLGVNAKTNEVAVFSIYTDEMVVRDQEL